MMDKAHYTCDFDYFNTFMNMYRRNYEHSITNKFNDLLIFCSFIDYTASVV
jgi:hypothetical protein